MPRPLYGAIAGALLLLYRHTPDCVVLYNCYRPPFRAIHHACRRLGVPVLHYEKGMLPHSFQLDPQGINAASSLAAETRPGPADAGLVERELQEVRRELFGTGQSGWGQPAQRVGPAELRRRLAVPEGRRVLLYVGQVEADSNMVAFSPHFGANAQAVRFLLSALPPDSDWFLLGKAHPKEHQDASAPQGLLDGRGAWTAGAHVHDCLELADCVASINSAVVLEAMLLHKPVVLLGRGVFSGKGVALEYDGRNPGEIASALSARRLAPFAEDGLIDYWCWRVACRWLYRCRPQDLPAEGRRAARDMLAAMPAGGRPSPEQVMELLDPLLALGRERERDLAAELQRLERRSQRLERIMNRWPVRLYRAARGLLRPVGEEQRDE